MGEIIRDWLRTRLGVIIDLSPEIFGHYARDGTLLAKVLHSYDVINDSQLSTLIQTQDPALARVNLKHLRVWLRFVGVDCDTDCIDDISNGKGTTSLRLFYKVFLCLENKDRLHFITLQKEREKYIPSSSKFDVTTVTEESEMKRSSERTRVDSLNINTSLVDWQRKKYKELIDGCKKDRDKFRASQEEDNAIGKTTISSSDKKSLTTGKRAKSLKQGAEMRELDEFARKHRVKQTKEIPDPCEDIVKHSGRRSKTPKIDHEAAKAYTRSLKTKHRQEALTKNFKTRMQKNLLTEIWKKVLDEQEMEFDEIVAKKVLHQSQYEKQLVRKLCDIRGQKVRMARNRAIVEELLEKTRENEMRLDQERAREVMIRESEEVEAERRRINELERRIEEQSRQRRTEKLVRFGEKVVRDLIDISMMTGDYKIRSNEDQVPKALWNQWKVLFFKGQPIIEAENEIIPRDEDPAVCEEIEEEDEARVEILNDEDFENYQNMKIPWKDFVPDVDDQVREYLNHGHAVLGYIVHKIMLENLDPDHQMEPVISPLPIMKTRAVVLGVPDSLLYEPIQELLKKSKIHLVRIEEAINHCLRRYKEEMKDFEYIDLAIIAATRENLNSSSINSETGLREKRVKKKIRKTSSIKRKISSSLEKIELSKSGVDKVTQTPRVIPHEDMDPSLSDAAYIGKWIHEFLTLGQPLSDELISRIIVEYLKSLENIEGFVIVNYPNTYRQMNTLEFALSGRRLPDNQDKLLNSSENTNIEEIESIPSRIVFDEEENNSEDLWRESRLVPNPTKSRWNTDGNSYLTAFVRIKPKPKDSEQKKDDDIWEILSDDATSVDTFYVDRDIASILYYTIFDLSTLKSLVRLLIAEKNELTAGASSEELFGEYLDYFEGRRDADYSAVNAPIVKKLLISRTSDYSFGESREFSESIDSTREEINVGKSVERSKNDTILPGEADWSWANLSQPRQFVRYLANLWQNLETCYVENLKQVFHLKRLTFDAILPYKDFVTRHMREIIDKPDKKQDLLHEFHCAYNEIDQDIRDDSVIKRELHCRINDFQTKLWEICDSRRCDADDERKRIIMDHWTTEQMINITNIYIDVLQAEIDRCNDTLQFIQDYYTSILQRPLQEIRQRVSLKKILLESRSSDNKQEILSTVNNSSKSPKERDSKETRVKQHSVSKIPPLAPDKNLFEEDITKLLTDVDRENLNLAHTLCYKTIEANIQYIQSIVESMSSRILDYQKKEETRGSKIATEFRDKRVSSRKVSRSSKTEQDNERKRADNVILEWRYAFMFEINRIRVRLKILEASAISDIDYVINGMRRVFSSIQKNLNDRYNSEIKSVNDMAKTFRFAVEEAKPIQQEMLLDAERFVVRSNVLMFPDKSNISNSPISEEISPSRFTISQLYQLVEIFHRSAPSGILPERSFVYIIEDLIVCDDEKNENSPLPFSWYELRACDVTKLVYELFADAEFVDWREFIIYAMEIKMPSVDEILNDLRAFRNINDKSEELVSQDEFFSIGLWFFDGNISEEDLLTTKSNSTIDSDGLKPEETFRLALIKKLLYQMFSSNCQMVNYVALLMAFCKDDKPEIGLAKALSLAIGNKICTNWENGEEYARELLNDKRQAVEARSNENDVFEEATKVSEAILNRLLKRVFRTSEPKIEDTVKNYASTMKEQKDVHKNLIDIERLDLLSTEDKTWISDLNEDNVRDERSEERKNRDLSITINLPKETKMIKRSRTDESPMVYWLRFDVSLSILAAMLTSHATQPDILESGKSLRENLQLLYHELRDEEINDEPGFMVLAHRFLHHDFVKKLLADTSKFTIKYLGNTIDKIIRNNR